MAIAANLCGIEPRGSKPKRYFTVDEVADLVNLSASTLRTYTYGRSDLVRGVDFYIRRFGPYRRQLFFTPRGVQRLGARAYSVGGFERGNGPSRFIPKFFLEADAKRYDGASKPEKRQRMLQRIYFAFKTYRSQPCAVPNCPCMIHRLGVPQAAEVYEVFPPGGRKK